MATYKPPTPEVSRVIARLEARLRNQQGRLLLRDAYYCGNQLIRDLGISLPPQMNGLNVVVDWPALAVDSIEERLDVEGFRYSSSADADEAVWGVWQANNLDMESNLAQTDALVFGHSFITVGSPPDKGDAPLVTVDSPLAMTGTLDVRAGTRLIEAFRSYRDDSGDVFGTLYLPDVTIHLASRGAGTWSVEGIDEHYLGEVPVVPMLNRSRTHERWGRSEITPAVSLITDAVCRTLLGLEVAREFYAAPQRYILGAAESAFQDADGNKKTAWETYTGRVLALEATEDPESGKMVLPQVGQFQPLDPSVYTKIIDMYAKIMSSMTGLPPHYLGYSSDNPASAEAIRSSEARLVKKAERKQRAFGDAWERAMRLALLIDGNGAPLPAEADRLETIWRDAATPTIAQTVDAAVKLVQVGVLPAESAVTLERVGMSAADITRVEADRKRSGSTQILNQIASSLVAREAGTVAGVNRGLAGGG